MTDDDFLAVHKLLSALEESDSGNPALDLRISKCLEDEAPVHVNAADAALTSELAPETVELIIGEVVAPFTRSLDAALPDEHIVFCMYSSRRSQWVAVHRCGSGREYVGWAATEPLARRAAALRGLKGIHPASGEAEVLDLVKSENTGNPAGRSPAGDDSAAADEPQPAWKVSF